MQTGLHGALALASIAVVLLTGAEAAVRAWRVLPAGRLADRLMTLAVLVLGITSAGGLGLLIGGASPSEGLHLVYAALAFAILPLTASLFGKVSARARGIAIAVAAIVALGIIVRLVQTG
jgi:hypothetical protein